ETQIHFARSDIDQFDPLLKFAKGHFTFWCIRTSHYDRIVCWERQEEKILESNILKKIGHKDFRCLFETLYDPGSEGIQGRASDLENARTEAISDYRIES